MKSYRDIIIFDNPHHSFTQTFSRDGMQLSVRRYSNFPCDGFHALLMQCTAFDARPLLSTFKDDAVT
jgi:hypothetical protein